MNQNLDFDQKTLHVVATPIGNLGDITYRAVEVLKQVGLVLAEDTRHTRKLFNHYEIKTPMKAYHPALEDHLSAVSRLCEHVFKEHEEIALVSDAGTPAVLDPGFKLIQLCHEKGIRVSPLPGANAGIALLSVSGIPMKNTLFYGFLPNKKGKRKNVLFDLLHLEKKNVLFYESPYRLKHLFEILCEFDQNLEVIVGKELTKKFEFVYRGTANSANSMFLDENIKGEFVVLVKNLS